MTTTMVTMATDTIGASGVKPSQLPDAQSTQAGHRAGHDDTEQLAEPVERQQPRRLVELVLAVGSFRR